VAAVVLLPPEGAVVCALELVIPENRVHLMQIHLEVRVLLLFKFILLKFYA
jgi:hypothetical protein